MKNNEALQRMSQTGCATIEKLIWIAGSWEDDRHIKEFMEDVDESFYKNYMPEISKSEDFEQYMGSPIEAFLNYEKYGFLAEIHLPKLSGFRFVGDDPVSWSVNQGVATVEYIYAESMDGILKIIEKLAKERYNKAWKEEFKKDNPAN